MKKAKVKVKVFQNLNGIKVLKEELRSGLKLMNKFELKILIMVNSKQKITYPSKTKPNLTKPNLT
jgi:hypothetical protein